MGWVGLWWFAFHAPSTEERLVGAGVLLSLVSPNQNARPCKKPCSLRTSCSNCTSHGMECMWCSSTRRCVDSNAYIISFPYGQCLEWQTATCSRKCLCPASFYPLVCAQRNQIWEESPSFIRKGKIVDQIFQLWQNIWSPKHWVNLSIARWSPQSMK